MLDADTLVFFTEEVMEMLPNWEKECLQLEGEMENPQFDALFRLAHNIKGSSKMVGLEDMGDLVHHVEDIINFLRDGKLTFTTEHVNLFLDVHSTLCDWIDNLGDDSSYDPQLKELLTRIESIKNGEGKIEKRKKSKEQIEKLESRLGELKEKSVPVQQVVIEEDLIIENLESLLGRFNFDGEGVCEIELKGSEIDTAGVQFLLVLKKHFGERLLIKYESQSVEEACGWLGAEKVLLG